MTPHPLARPAGLAAVAGLLVALAGCSVQLVDPDATPTPPVSQPGATDGPDVPSDKPGTSERDAAIAAATTTLACTDELVVDQHAAVVRVDGDCDEVTVAADGAIVILDDVRELRVSGSATTVYVLNLGQLALTGDAVIVRWQGTAPEVTDDGTANLIERDPS